MVHVVTARATRRSRVRSPPLHHLVSTTTAAGHWRLFVRRGQYVTNFCGIASDYLHCYSLCFHYSFRNASSVRHLNVLATENSKRVAASTSLVQDIARRSSQSVLQFRPVGRACEIPFSLPQDTHPRTAKHIKLLVVAKIS